MGITEEKIVVDTNVLISSLINPEFIVWKIIGLEDTDFFSAGNRNKPKLNRI